MKSITLYAVGLIWMLSSSQAYAHESWRKTDNNARHFTENKGQVTDQYLVPRSDIDFKLSAGNGLNVFMGKGHISYQWAKPINTASPDGTDPEYATYELYRMDVALLGANRHAEVQVAERQPGHERFFQPWVNTQNSNSGVIAHRYSRITYRDVYPYIDWVFYFNDKGQLEHDFVVRPGGNVSDIKMQYRGASNLELTANGSLSAHTVMGTITEQAPIARESTGRRVPVRFVLTKDVLQYEVSAYSGTLTIDPVVEWGTYFGGVANDAGMDLATDKWGYVYLCGSTNSVANIATTGAHQASFGGAGNDAFLSKWNSQGELLWASYYGGTNVDIARGVSCDTLGNVYIGGNTNSNNGIATPGSFQDTFTAFAHDAFIVKFDSSGIRQWGTYFGGFSNNEANTSFGICIDFQSNILITGNTQSNDFPVTAGAHQSTISGGHDGFVAKFNALGTLIWSTYCGGSSSDYPYDLATDLNGNVYITGFTQSVNNIATPGSYQSIIGGGQDAFVIVFNQDGQRQWGSYIGGTEADQARSIAVSDSKVFVVGVTAGSSGLATPNAHQVGFGGGQQDGFITCFNFTGQRLWSTYYGGTLLDNLSRGAWCDSTGNVYVAGETTSTDAIASIGAINETIGGLTDLCIVKFSETGERLWGTYLGGSDIDYEPRITGDRLSNIYITGKTNSGTGISTSLSPQPNLGGGYDGFVIKINDCAIPPTPDTIFGPLAICPNTSITYFLGSNMSEYQYEWILPIGWSGYSDSGSINTIVGTLSGEIKLVAKTSCGGVSDTQRLMVNVYPEPIPNIVANGHILSTTQPYDSYQWRLDGEDIVGAIGATYIVTQNGQYNVKVLNSYGCDGISDAIDITGIVSTGSYVKDIDIDLYPNPVTEDLLVTIPIDGVGVLESLDGRVLKTRLELFAGPNRISMRGFTSGLYSLKIQTKTQIFVLPIVKR